MTRSDLASADAVLREAAYGTARSLAIAVKSSNLFIDQSTINDDLVALAESETIERLALRIGISILELGGDRRVANELFKIAFYRSERSLDLVRNDYYGLFLANRGIAPVDKWIHYFDVYERHLNRFRNTDARVLEIGVFRGGGLMLLQRYLGPSAAIAGVDIDDAARVACAGRFDVMVGDQSDPQFLHEVIDRHGPFDIVVDDGGHRMSQQITSLEVLLPHVRAGGVYVVEDCHTSYWADYQDHPQSFIEFAKARIDDINAFHTERLVGLSPWSTLVDGIHFHDSIVVFDRADRTPPFCEVSGAGTTLIANREQLISDTHEQTIRTGLTSEIEGAMKAVARVEAERDAVMHASALREREHHEEIRDLYATRSWRVTEPLRRIARLIRDDD